MTTKIQIDSALIETFEKSHAAAKQEAARCGTALSEAERIAASAPGDDAQKSPEELYERQEQTRKDVFLRSAEARRASAKVEEIESEFLRIAIADAPNITAALVTKLEETRTTLKSQLSPLVAAGGTFGQVALSEFVNSCDEVHSRARALRIIGMNHFGGGLSPTGSIQDLCLGLGLALKLL